VYTIPRSRPGQWAMWLLLVVATYPLYWSVTLLIPESWRAVRLGVGFVVIALALTSLALAGVAVFVKRDRSVLLVTLAAVTLVLVLAFAIGEVAGPH
jgi:hypothetical protein